MDKNGQHGCFTLSVLSIVICAFVRYKIPLQKAHIICKIINVQNYAKLASTNVRAIKSTVGYSERSSILTASEKHLPYKVFDYSVKIYVAQYHTPLKNFMDNLQPITRKKSIPYPACFLTIRAWIQWFVFYSPFFPLYLAYLGHKFTPRYIFPAEHVSYGRVILRTRLSIHSYVVQIGAKTQADARVALSGAFMLTCNKIQNWFTKITVRLLYGYTTLRIGQQHKSYKTDLKLLFPQYSHT